MLFKKRKLFLGVALGVIGLSLYKSIKNHKKTLKYMEGHDSNHNSSPSNMIRPATEDNVEDYIHKLKTEINILEEKLNKLQD